MSSISFDNSYAKLPSSFYAKLQPKPVASPSLIKVNHKLANSLGVDAAFLESAEGVAILAGNRVPEGAEPLAMAYAGHQFGNFVPQLGDGRANLLGEVLDNEGNRRDLQLKGAGPTPFSRMGDGRAALGPVLREYIVSEAMAALGVPTTRALAAVTTGEPVVRENFQLGAILTRVASSHIRVGTFQYFFAREDIMGLETLLTHVINRHYPEAAFAERPALALLDHVVEKQAKLIAKWVSLGFIHGVMNTDNMSIAGETIDYGPCAFLDTYEPSKHFSAVDQNGRYAYQNQPAIGQWNLVRLAQCLLGMLDKDEDTALELAQASIDAYGEKFDAAFMAEFTAKIGLDELQDDDKELVKDLLKRMAENQVDFTLMFRGLGGLLNGGDGPAHLFTNPTAFEEWETVWRERLATMNEPDDVIAKRILAANPAIIPRNHLVEEAIRAAEDNNDFSVFHALVEALETPFDDQAEGSKFTQPPQPQQVVQQTFCGT
ncbi:MAG: protein adenylyltransferase SelO [Hyphomicrobiales bacterium]